MQTIMKSPARTQIGRIQYIVSLTILLKELAPRIGWKKFTVCCKTAPKGCSCINSIEALKWSWHPFFWRQDLDHLEDDKLVSKTQRVAIAKGQSKAASVAVHACQQGAAEITNGFCEEVHNIFRLMMIFNSRDKGASAYEQS